MPRFSDEEEDEQSDVADAWDASSEDEAPAPKPVESISTKPKLKQILKKDKTSIPAPKKTPDADADEKERIRLEIETAEMETAMDTFSVKERKPSASSLNIKLPSNKLEVELYTKNLAAALAGLEKSGYYNFLVESLITKVCLPLTADETRKIATLLQTQEKDKREKAKKSSKKSLYGGKTGGKNDMTDYGNENLYEGEYDDFM